jgi:hypothetical protein
MCDISKPRPFGDLGEKYTCIPSSTKFGQHIFKRSSYVCAYKQALFKGTSYIDEIKNSFEQQTIIIIIFELTGT